MATVVNQPRDERGKEQGQALTKAVQLFTGYIQENKRKEAYSSTVEALQNSQSLEEAQDVVGSVDPSLVGTEYGKKIDALYQDLHPEMETMTGYNGMGQEVTFQVDPQKSWQSQAPKGISLTKAETYGYRMKDGTLKTLPSNEVAAKAGASAIEKIHGTGGELLDPVRFKTEISLQDNAIRRMAATASGAKTNQAEKKFESRYTSEKSFDRYTTRDGARNLVNFEADVDKHYVAQTSSSLGLDSETVVTDPGFRNLLTTQKEIGQQVLRRGGTKAQAIHAGEIAFNMYVLDGKFALEEMQKGQEEGLNKSASSRLKNMDTIAANSRKEFEKRTGVTWNEYKVLRDNNKIQKIPEDNNVYVLPVTREDGTTTNVNIKRIGGIIVPVGDKWVASK